MKSLRIMQTVLRFPLEVLEFDRGSALDSYCGYVGEMDDLVGYKLKVISAYGGNRYHGSYDGIIQAICLWKQLKRTLTQ